METRQEACLKPREVGGGATQMREWTPGAAPALRGNVGAASGLPRGYSGYSGYSAKLSCFNLGDTLPNRAAPLAFHEPPNVAVSPWSSHLADLFYCFKSIFVKFCRMAVALVFLLSKLFMKNVMFYELLLLDFSFLKIISYCLRSSLLFSLALLSFI